MYNTKQIRDIIEAIESVKIRARIAWDTGDRISAVQLGGDLAALECCLTYEVKHMLNAEIPEAA